MDTTFHLVSSEQSKNNAVLRQGVLKKDGTAVTCLYVGPVNQCDILFDEVQLTELASIDNTLMKAAGDVVISNMEVYANGAINLFLKNTITNLVEAYLIVRPSASEEEHYDLLAEQHGQA